ncbi:MAG: hypothetical protein ABI761_19190 [Saprospiraceae bacterium]
MIEIIFIYIFFLFNVFTKNDLPDNFNTLPKLKFQKEDSLTALIKNLKSNPGVYEQYEKLNLFYSKNYSNLSIKRREEVRDLLNKFGTWHSIQLCDKNEPGSPLKLTGRIIDENNNPVALAKITIYQADVNGSYAPQDATTHGMSENDPRLYGSILTGKDGNYSLGTIHPGSYPMLYEGRHIPQHIHFNIVAKGYQNQNLQIAFDDDPAMKDKHWQDWAKDLKYPVVKLEFKGSIHSSVLNIKLKRV